MEDRKVSLENEKKVRIMKKNEAVKLDPRSVKAPIGKSALKKDGEDTPSPEPSPQRVSAGHHSLEKVEKVMSEHRQSDENKKLQHKDEEGKNAKLDLKTTKDEQKSATTGENVVNSKVLSKNLDGEGNRREPNESVINEKPPSAKLNVGDGQGTTREPESKPLPKELVSTPKDKEKLSGMVEGTDTERRKDDVVQDAPSSPDAMEGKLNKPPTQIKEEEIAVPGGTLKIAEVAKPLEVHGKSGTEDEQGKLETGDENENDSEESSSSIAGENSQSKGILLPTGETNVPGENGNDHGTNEVPNSNTPSERPVDPNIKAASEVIPPDEKGNIIANENPISNTASESTPEPNNQAAAEVTLPEEKRNVIAEIDVHNDDGARDAADSPSTTISIKVRRKTNEDNDESALNGKSTDINEAKHEETRTSIPNNVVMPLVSSSVERESDVTVTTNSNSLMNSNVYNSQNTVERDATETGEEPTTVKETGMQEMESHSPTETHDNYDDDQHRVDKLMEGTNAFQTNGSEKQKDDDDDEFPASLGRTTASEDLKINEIKKRVRPGQCFLVKGNSESYDVRWAEKRKVLAYKVGSRNTSRFSTLLIETVEQLERASVRHPSILSEFKHPTNEAKGSLLSTYFAGTDARRSIKHNFTRETGTNTEQNRDAARQKSLEYNVQATDQRNEIDARPKSPEYKFWATDHISPDKETFGGIAPKQQTTAGSTIQSSNYNYPFLTDYDTNHERKGT